MIKSKIFTKKEIEVINKKLKNERLSQVDSNYLYKFIKPKLKEMASIDAGNILNKMEYNQKIISVENKIRKIILESIKEAEAIILYGSAIQDNYRNYNDIDILIITKRKLYNTIKEKHQKISEIKKQLAKYSILADIQIYNKGTLNDNYPHSPSLIYQLKDNKVIYGKLKLPNKIELYNANLQMKLDWSDISDIEPEGIDIYKALRNVVLVRLLLNKIIDNRKLKESLNEEVGKNLIEKLKSNQVSNEEKRIALKLLKELSDRTRQELRGDLWEKIEL